MSSIRALLWGLTGLLQTGLATATLAQQSADGTRLGGAIDAELGYAVTDAGDLNGDGYRDLAVSGYGFSNGQVGEGAVFLHFGSSAGMSATPDLTLEINQANARLGAAISGGFDLNGDGFDDLVVGAPMWDEGGNVDAGRMLVFLGGTAMDATADLSQVVLQSSAQYGASVASVGDVNGDGFGDWLVGAPTFDNSAVNNGSAFLYFGGTTLNNTADATLFSSAAGVEFGTSVAGAGDVNGDGFADIVIGVPKYQNGSNGEGAFFVYLGGSGAFNTGTDLHVESNVVGTQLGRTVFGIGDVNGDGFSDLGVNATDTGTPNNVWGRVLVYHGSAVLNGIADAEFSNPGTSFVDFGQALAAGDVNGDGFSDLIFGAPRFVDFAPEEGRLIVHLGSSQGLQATAYRSFSRSIINERFGSAVAVVDMNRDGFGDVVVGAPRFSGGTTNQGALLYYRGGTKTPNLVPDIEPEGSQVGGQLGYSMATGDINGDGIADLAAGHLSHDLNAQTINSGRVSLFFGQAGGISTTATVNLDGTVANARFGSSVSIGDVNGDGFGDLIVGAPNHNTVAVDAGAVSVFLGGSGAFDTQADLTLQGAQASAFFGTSVAALGDINGDGFGDFAVGAPGFDATLSDAGRVSVYFGAATLDGSVDLTLDGATGGANFGRAVAGLGDMNGDGFGDVAVGSPGHDITGFSNVGLVSVYVGGATVNGTADLNLVGASVSGANWGTSVAGAGDVNGDGFADLIMGGPLNGSGRARVCLGAASLTSPTVIELSQAPDGSAGFAVAGGDVNSDGFSDVLIGSPGNGSGGAALYLGSSTFDNSMDWNVSSGETLSRQGQSVALADVSGDGTADILIGAPNMDVPFAGDGGALQVHLGNGGGRDDSVQQFNDYGIAPLYAQGRTGVNMNVAVTAFSAQGRERVRMEVELCPQGRPFGDVNCSRHLTSSWQALPANGSGTMLNVPIDTLAQQMSYQWRARLWYAPMTITTAGITIPTELSRIGPWHRQQGRAMPYDFRVFDQLFRDGFE